MLCVMKNIVIWRSLVSLLLLDQCSCQCKEEGDVLKTLIPAYIDDYGEIIQDHYEEKTLSILITCSGSHLPLLPISRKYSCEDCPKTLKILDTQISEVPSSAFMSYSDFNILYLENLGIEKILPVAFNSLISVKELYLSQNRLEQLFAGVFNSLNELEILDLSYNKIRDIGTHCFTGAVNLKLLNLSSNNLVIFSDLILDENTNHIRYMDLSFNNISELNFGPIMQVVDGIDLSNNQINKLIDGMFGIENVNISRNKLKNLKVENRSTNSIKITHFDVGYNEIFQLNSNFSLPSLQTLNLEHNNISKIPLEFFFNLSHLVALNLSYNQLEQLHYGTFDQLENLQILDISHNKLQRIEEYLHSLSNLTELNIDSNMLDNLNSKQLLEYLPTLSKLSLENNNFTCNNLTNIVHDFRRKNVRIPRGHTSSITNILGIACYDDSLRETSTESIPNISSDFINVSSIISTSTKNEELMDYFNKDFVNSNFYKFMENFSQSHPFKIEENSIYKYFNEDFKKSQFFEYLENFNNDRNSTAQFQEYFNNFTNSSFVKYLENFKNNQNFFNEVFEKSDMYNFFNHDFKKTEFYKNLRNVSCPLFFLEQSEHGNSSNFNSLKDNYSEISVTITILLVIIVSLLLIQIFIVYNAFIRKKYNRNEQIELMKD